ncbi:MAG: hypothetical protein NC320_03595 [Clostridium sp.]|nr:hypothetical protein [Clostridium sp.]MCM1547200.1 hypothetical protein [Ruminococcus sp.]
MKSRKIDSNKNYDIWLKRAASVFGMFYTVFVCIMSYFSIFYEIVVTRRVLLAVFLSVISILAGTAMIYSRKQILTKISGFVMFPVLLPVVILSFGTWEVIIPLAACAVVIFFANASNEGAKILLGTIYLMVYILAALAYFIFTSFLASPALKETIDKGVSPSGKYRYEVVDTTDSSGGCTSILLEPNFMDRDYPGITFKVKGYNRTLCVKRPKTEVELKWDKDDLYVNDERWFTPQQSVKGKWFEKENRSWDIF